MTSWTDLAVPDAPPIRVHRADPELPRGSTVVLLHELFGVDAGLEDLADLMAADGHTVLAPELYHRSAEPGLVLPRDEAGRTTGFDHLGRLSRDDVVASVRSTVGAATDSGRVGLLGFSAGGHAAFLSATRPPVAVTVCVYPGWLTGPGGQNVPMAGPTATLDESQELHGRVVVLVGERDHVIDSAEIDAVEKALEGAGVDHEVVRLAGAGHAFFWPGTPPYDATARDLAWQIVRAELDRL